jgi:hypothetical protein
MKTFRFFTVLVLVLVLCQQASAIGFPHDPMRRKPKPTTPKITTSVKEWKAQWQQRISQEANQAVKGTLRRFVPKGA